MMSMLILTGITFSQTATNFTANDCAGNSHNLFSKLDLGEVVVIAWVMPCSSCIGPAKTAYNAAQNFAISHPGIVDFYLVDDYANTSCASLVNWGNSNSMPLNTAFSSSAISMSDYGSAGMPKVVVLGGSSHTVYLNLNSGVTNSNVTAAINSALAVTGINETPKMDFQLKVFPNPVTDKFSVSYSLLRSGNVKLDVVNILGEKVKEIVSEKQSAGQHDLSIGTENMNAGIYFLKVTVNDCSQLVKFTVSH